MLPIFLLLLATLLGKQWLDDLRDAIEDAECRSDEKGAIEAAENSDDGR